MIFEKTFINMSKYSENGSESDLETSSDSDGDDIYFDIEKEEETINRSRSEAGVSFPHVRKNKEDDGPDIQDRTVIVILPNLERVELHIGSITVDYFIDVLKQWNYIRPNGRYHVMWNGITLNFSSNMKQLNINDDVYEIRIIQDDINHETKFSKLADIDRYKGLVATDMINITIRLPDCDDFANLNIKLECTGSEILTRLRNENRIDGGNYQLQWSNAEPIKLEKTLYEQGFKNFDNIEITRQKKRHLEEENDEDVIQTKFCKIKYTFEMIRTKCTITDFSVGASHAAAVLSDGSVIITGDPSYIARGYVDKEIESESYTIVQDIHNAKKVGCGLHFTAVLTSSGNLYINGAFKDEDTEGNVDIKQFSDHFEYIKIDEFVTDIAVGFSHVIVLTSEKNVYSLGCCRQYQTGLSINQPTERFIPERINLKNINRIFCGPYNSFAIRDNNKIYAWGLNNYGQTGIKPGKKGDRKNFIKTPTIVKSLKTKNITQISASKTHTFFLNEKGKMTIYGNKSYSSLSNVIRVSAGDVVDIIQMQNGNVYCCHANETEWHDIGKHDIIYKTQGGYMLFHQ